jgi:hypothetical protein
LALNPTRNRADHVQQMTTLRAKRSRTFLIALTLGGIVLAGCHVRPTPTPGPAAPAPAAPTTPVIPGTPLTIRGSALATPAQLVAWFSGRTPRPSGTYAATVPVQSLAQYYVDDGTAEGIRGDVAFIQSILETGWFRFGARVPGSYNNFAGIGATNGGGAPAVFPDARTGVRAQIQHLRAYADVTATTCTVPPLRNPCVDPRFALVLPKGRAQTWNVMGNGNWASSTTYAQRILQLYAEMLRYNGLPVPY